MEDLTITEASGLVSQLDDLSGNDNHATQKLGSVQPITGTHTINGLNALYYGNLAYLAISSGLFDFTENDNTVFIVHALDEATATTNNQFLLITNSYYDIGYKTTYLRGRHDSSSISSLTLTPDGDAHIAALRREDTTSAIVSLDGVEGNTSIASDVTGNTYIHIGSKYSNHGNFLGSIGEVIIYGRALTSSEMNQVGQYLSAKWGTSWTDVE